MRRGIARIELSFFVHATENRNKVLEAVRNILPKHRIEEMNFSKKHLEGARGNPVIIYKTRIRKKEMSEEILENIGSNLSTLDRERLVREFTGDQFLIHRLTP